MHVEFLSGRLSRNFSMIAVRRMFMQAAVKVVARLALL